MSLLPANVISRLGSNYHYRSFRYSCCPYKTNLVIVRSASPFCRILHKVQAWEFPAKSTLIVSQQE